MDLFVAGLNSYVCNAACLFEVFYLHKFVRLVGKDRLVQVIITANFSPCTI